MYNRRKVNMKFPGAVGLYVCILLLPVLKIEAQPAITKTDTSAPYGIISQTTALTCTDGTYDPTTSTFKFFKDSVEILNHIGETTTTGKYTAATSTGSIQMTILDVVISDQGSYSCSVGFNTAGSSFSLQVEVKPTNDTTATVGLCTGPGNDYSGDKLTFTCTDLYPSPTVQSVTDGTQTVVGTTNITTKTNSMFDLEWTASSSPKDYILTVAITTRSTYTFTVESNIKAGLDGTCSTMAPIIQCSTENAECSAADKCKCKTGYEPNAAATECIVTTTTTPTPECSDCCCCDDKKARDGACGAVLGVCIGVMVLLVICCCYKGFPPKHVQGKLILICAIIVFIAALVGLILSAVCLSKECCSCSGDSCQVKNCFKGDAIAGFVMTGLSVFGTVIVIILICLITGESGSGKKKAENEELKAK